MISNAREIVAWNVRRVRVSRGMSSEALAADAGVDRVYMGRIERGIANPAVDLLEGIAGALKVEISRPICISPTAEARPTSLPDGRRHRLSPDQPKPENTDQYEVRGDDVIEDARNRQN